MKRNIVTAQEVAEATGQSVETVAREWHDIANDQDEVEAEASASAKRRVLSDD